MTRKIREPLLSSKCHKGPKQRRHVRSKRKQIVGPALGPATPAPNIPTGRISGTVSGLAGFAAESLRLLGPNTLKKVVSVFVQACSPLLAVS
jgi:hypothetical protein